MCLRICNTRGNRAQCDGGRDGTEGTMGARSHERLVDQAKEIGLSPRGSEFLMTQSDFCVAAMWMVIQAGRTGSSRTSEELGKKRWGLRDGRKGETCLGGRAVEGVGNGAWRCWGAKRGVQKGAGDLGGWGVEFSGLHAGGAPGMGRGSRGRREAISSGLSGGWWQPGYGTLHGRCSRKPGALS